MKIPVPATVYVLTNVLSTSCVTTLTAHANLNALTHAHSTLCVMIPTVLATVYVQMNVHSITYVTAPIAHVKVYAQTNAQLDSKEMTLIVLATRSNAQQSPVHLGGSVMN